jgi:hypothetical protein
MVIIIKKYQKGARHRGRIYLSLYQIMTIPMKVQFFILEIIEIIE